MDKFKFIIGFSAFSLILSACSETEVITEDNNDQTIEEVTGIKFQKLGEINIESELGESSSESPETRTPGSVDQYDRPSGNYMLDYVGLISVSTTEQPTAGQIGQIITTNYQMKSSYKEYSFKKDSENGTNNFELYYSIIEEKEVPGCTNQGVLVLASDENGSNPIKIDLSIIETEKLTDQILLNDFAYQDTEGHSITSPRGSSLFFLTYNPEVSELSSTALRLPQISKSQLPDGAFETLTDSYYPNLYDEYGDKLFVSDEMIAFADNNKIYFYTVTLARGTSGGYHMSHAFTLDKNKVNNPKMNLKRLTTIVNASFMLIDQAVWTADSYLQMSDGTPLLQESINAYKNKFGLDLSDMTCPYATIDGINTVYEVNDRTSGDNTKEPDRLLLWADGYNTVAPNGQIYPKYGTFSEKIYYALKDDVVRGLGIKGNSYSVVFPGSIGDFQNVDLNFYVTVAGVNVKITAQAPSGISFDQNKTHNIILMINAEDFANHVKAQEGYKSRTANETPAFGNSKYSTFTVPAANMVIQ